MEIKAIIAAINSKYIHSSLAIRYLAGYCHLHNFSVTPMEFNINQDVERVAYNILKEEPDLVAISVYIWNISFVSELSSILKQADKDLTLILGGPEVTYDSEEILERNPSIDIIIRGEGEVALTEVLEAAADRRALKTVKGITYRDPDTSGIATNEDRPPIEHLDSIPPAYNPSEAPINSIDNLKGRIAYYETSRGCPFRCQYCLSSITPGVRYFSLDRIKGELPILISSGTPTIKFVDRTFNCDKARAREIWRYLIDISPQSPPYQTVFHFEIAGDLLDETDIELLSHAPVGLFQFEIGVQSTNPETLDIISRRTVLENLSRSVRALTQLKNIIINIDLIAGLPEDTYESFADAIDYVLDLRPTNIHLGFLKLLRGSGLRNSAQRLGLHYRTTAPYEIIKTETLDFQEMIKIKEIEDILDRYYNSGKYRNTLDYCFDIWTKPSAFLSSFAEFWENMGYFDLGQSPSRYGSILQDFIDSAGVPNAPDISVFLRYDAYLAERPASGGIRVSESIVNYIRTEHQEYQELDSREVSRRLFIATFPFNVAAAAKADSPGSKRRIVETGKDTMIAFLYGRRDVNCRVEKEIILEGVF